MTYYDRLYLNRPSRYTEFLTDPVVDPEDYEDLRSAHTFSERTYAALCLGGPNHGETLQVRVHYYRVTVTKLLPYENDTEEFMGALAGSPLPMAHGCYIAKHMEDADGVGHPMLLWTGWKP